MLRISSLFVSTWVVLLACIFSTIITTIDAQAISVNRACIKTGDIFTITFQNVDQLETDWIGIIPSTEDPNSFNTIGIWVWTCGSQSCSGAVASGRVNLRANNVATGSWRAVLARDQASGPFSAYAASSIFTIAASCSSSPVPAPVAAPSSSGGGNDVALQHINDARNEIESLIDNDITLAAQFLRLAFHDCIGGCDGCIDVGNSDNAGIEPSIDILQPIVDQHALDGVSRADIWALSSVVGVDVSQRSDSRINYRLTFWGRVDCENTGAACIGADGQAVTCSAKQGPHHEFPNIHMNTHELFSFFSDEFGFNQRDAVAAMGAHTIGVVRQEDFNIDAPNGWVLENRVFDNGYYEELVGGTSPNDPVEVLINEAPAWRRIIENGQRFWVGFPEGVKIIMLNSDISLVRNLDSSNFDPSIGRVSCTFEDNTATDTVSVCPHVEGALQIAAEFFHDNEGWLREFRSVLERMLANGYSLNACSDEICQLAVSA